MKQGSSLYWHLNFNLVFPVTGCPLPKKLHARNGGQHKFCKCLLQTARATAAQVIKPRQMMRASWRTVLEGLREADRDAEAPAIRGRLPSLGQGGRQRKRPQGLVNPGVEGDPQRALLAEMQTLPGAHSLELYLGPATLGNSKT